MKISEYYDKLIDENNDPVHDEKPLRDYMDKWDGEDFINALSLTPDKAALEIGVGTGRLAIRVAPLCKTLCGIDISRKTVERAEENLREHKNVTLICDDFLSHSFVLTFDVVYSSLTFMHIEEKQAAIFKAAGLLKQGGIFALSIDKNPCTVIDAGVASIDIFPDTKEEISSYLNSAGLTPIKTYETEHAYIFIYAKMKDKKDI